jgi:hypothetical protein
MTRYYEFIQRKVREYPTKFDPTELNQAFVDAFNSQERITVEFTYGATKEIKRGRIGVTTGWKPCFLLMLTRRSIGSSYTINKNARIVL